MSSSVAFALTLEPAPLAALVTMETERTLLGLHLVRLIVEQLGGTIWCDSAEGHGATFGLRRACDRLEETDSAGRGR